MYLSPLLVSKPQFFFTFIFAVLLHFCSCYVVLGTWYGVRDIHNFEVLLERSQPLPSSVLKLLL